jgi:hypothetical protein
MLLEEAVNQSSLLPDQKMYFQNRYLELVSRYRKKYKRINFMYNTLRMTVMIGSIFIPALLTLQKDPTTVISITTYWVVFALSLCVTLSNSMLELFNVAAVNTKYWLHVQRLEAEGWQFLNLTETYVRFETVNQGFQKFTSKVEKLHLSLVFDMLRLENRNKSLGSKSEKDMDKSLVNTASVGGSMRGEALNSLGPGYNRTVALLNTLQETASNDSSLPSLHENQPDLVLSMQEFQSRLEEDASEKKEA